jgi:hypothetical protein
MRPWPGNRWSQKIAPWNALPVVASMLSGLSPVDSVTYSAVPLILVPVAVLASLAARNACEPSRGVARRVPAYRPTT